MRYKQGFTDHFVRVGWVADAVFVVRNDSEVVGSRGQQVLVGDGELLQRPVARPSDRRPPRVIYTDNTTRLAVSIISRHYDLLYSRHHKLLLYTVLHQCNNTCLICS